VGSKVQEVFSLGDPEPIEMTPPPAPKGKKGKKGKKEGEAAGEAAEDK
jgi:hypothetical protein